ncbi:MAG: DNA polymerase III subunit delta [Candidatus Thioglobus sp. TMED218]|nr:DNA polymerase III subunit delta [Candidatus Thioglobus sp.]OUW82498.1 MAG: DNA polymerase III subunit delta [Candidatus Thioglobus sp. TMED218]
MNIKPEQLQNSLSNQLASTYFAFGAEILLVEQSLSMIKGIARENGFKERFRFDIDGNFSWDSIISLISSPSLFAEKRIIECRLTTGKIGIKGSKALTEILETLPDDILLIISSGKLEMAQQKSKWFKTLDKKGIIIQHWEVQSNQLVGWITRNMSQLGLDSNIEIANAIAYCTEGNLLASMQEIQKLKIAYPDGKINLREYLNQIDQQSQYSVFGMIDSALQGDTDKVNKVFNSLVDDSTPPVILVSSLYREIKNLVNMSIELKKNQTIESILNNHRVWQKRKPLISNALKKHSYQKLQKLLLRLGRIDRSLKGMDNLDVYDELQNVVIALSGKNNGLNS